MQRIKGGDSTSSTTSLEKGRVIADAKRLYEALIYNNGGSDVYIQLHDAADVPANGSAPKNVQKCPAGSQISFFYMGGRPMENGIVLVGSSTVNELTVMATDDLWIDVVYL